MRFALRRRWLSLFSFLEMYSCQYALRHSLHLCSSPSFVRGLLAKQETRFGRLHLVHVFML
jgi:hypothetical protein